MKRTIKSENPKYVVMVDNQFIAVKSYGEFRLVDDPESATLYTRKKDAESRLEQVKYFIDHFNSYNNPTVKLSKVTFISCVEDITTIFPRSTTWDDLV